MSEGPPRTCRDCLGKFRLGAGPEICEVCRLTLRIRQLLLSDRYPAEGGDVAAVQLRECLWRLLEHSDTYWGNQEKLNYEKRIAEKGIGKGEHPKGITEEEKEKRKKEEAEPSGVTPVKKEEKRSASRDLPGLCGKAPPVKPPPEVEAASSGHKSPKPEEKKVRSKSRGRRRDKRHRERSIEKERRVRERVGVEADVGLGVDRAVRVRLRRRRTLPESKRRVRKRPALLELENHRQWEIEEKPDLRQDRLAT